MRAAMKRRPTTPGEILQEEFLTPLGLSQKALADHLGCDLKVINRVVNGRMRIGAALALRLGAALNTTPEFWLNAQKAVDLFDEVQKGASLPTPLFRRAAEST